MSKIVLCNLMAGALQRSIKYAEDFDPTFEDSEDKLYTEQLIAQLNAVKVLDDSTMSLLEEAFQICSAF